MLPYKQIASFLQRDLTTVDHSAYVINVYIRKWLKLESSQPFLYYLIPVRKISTQLSKMRAK